MRTRVSPVPARVLADQLTGDAAVLGQYQQPRRVDVEPPRGRKAPEMREVEAQRRAVALEARLRRYERHRRAIVLFRLRGHVTHRLVEQDRDRGVLPGLGGSRIAAVA